MSVVEYRVFLYQFSEEIDWQTQRTKLIFILRAFLPDGSEERITDINSLLTTLEEENILGIDRLNVMKELLKGIRKWDLLRIVERFEIKRKEYRQLLDKISRTFDKSTELQRLISICRGKYLITRESEEDIVDVNALFTVLEQQNNLGIEDLTLLKTLASEMKKPDLCRLLEEFEKKRKQEEDAQRERKEWEDNMRRARVQTAFVLAGGINIGERVIGVVTPHCTFRNLTGGAVVVTTWMVLRRSTSLEAFVNAFKEAVLPVGTFLRALSEGSTRFTIQAETISALDELWRSYQDETLQKNLQEFLVTEEIKQLAGGEVSLTVHIDEDEYSNAVMELMVPKTEELKLEEKKGLKDRASSDSDLLKEQDMVAATTKDLFPESELFVENLPKNYSEITQSSDSGKGTWSSASSECGVEKGDITRTFYWLEYHIKDAIENWSSFLETWKDTYPCAGRKIVKMKEEMESIDSTLETLKVIEINAGPILKSSSSPDATAHQLARSLQLDEGFFRSATAGGKIAIRVLAGKAKDLERMDVFDLLRRIARNGTTGPRLSDNMPVEEIPIKFKKELTGLLGWVYSGISGLKGGMDLRPHHMTLLNSVSVVDVIAMRHGLRTVGELYDFLCEHGLNFSADYL